MKITLPLTGTVKAIQPGHKPGLVEIYGENEDPIRPVHVDLGDVSWVLVEMDLDAEEMTIEVTAAPTTKYDTGKVDEEGKPIYAGRPATEQEKADRVAYAQSHSLSHMSHQALYALSGSPPLKNPFKVDPD